MANVALAITPTRDIQVFTGNVGTGINPRARVTFTTIGATIVAKGAGDTQSLTIDLSLPPNYAYVADYILLNFNCPTEATGADDFARGGSLLLKDGRQSTFNLQAALDSVISRPSDLNVGSTRSWTPVDLYRGVFWNYDGVIPLIRLQINDEDGTNARAVANLSVFCTILQYDIEQATDVQVNAPLPVRAC